jgi:uncharacterized membrane protein
MIQKYLDNNFIVSGVGGLLCVIISIIYLKKSKKKVNYSNQLKLLVLVSIIIFGVIYLKTGKLPTIPSIPSSGGGGSSKFTNVDIGEPNF